MIGSQITYCSLYAHQILHILRNSLVSLSLKNDTSWLRTRRSGVRIFPGTHKKPNSLLWIGFFSIWKFRELPKKGSSNDGSANILVAPKRKLSLDMADAQFHVGILSSRSTKSTKAVTRIPGKDGMLSLLISRAPTVARYPTDSA